WASDKDKIAMDGQFHSNFKISSSGEALTLKDPEGTVVDMVNIISLGDNMSYGRSGDGEGEFLVFSKSTPGFSNTTGEKVVMEPVFSHEGGFYNEEFELKLSTNDPQSKIYYTTDSSDPLPGKESTYEYSQGITVKNRAGEPNYYTDMAADVCFFYKPDSEVFKCFVVKAVAVDANGSKSRVITNSYFVAPNMEKRYDVPVISLVTDPDNLFLPDEGLFSGDGYIMRGAEWEKPVHIEFFENDGTPGFSHNSGLRLHGALSRMIDQRALRLYADRGYDEKNEFNYSIFPGLKDIEGNEINSFKRLILRASGNDVSRTMFRDAMMHKLVSHLNLDTQAYRPSAVFLNGEFWGLYNIRERYDNRYYESHYNLDRKNVAILEYNSGYAELNEGTEDDLNAYLKDVIEYIKSNPMSSSEHYDYIKTKIDIDNFIDYQISNIYFSNTDWPGNNVALWKYKTKDGQYHPEAPYGQDGRWRWSLKDVDDAFGLRPNDTDNLMKAIYAVSTDNHFAGLLDSQEFRNKFINRYADLINTCFEPERVNQVINEMKSGIETIIDEHIERWNFIKDWDEKVKVLNTFATERPYYARQHIVNNFKDFGVTGTSEITLSTDTIKGYIRINTIDIKKTTPGVPDPDTWTGIYFKGVPIVIEAIAEDGYLFDYWEGVEADNKNMSALEFSPDENMNITAVFKPKTSEPKLRFGDVNGDGKVNSTDCAYLKRYILEIPEYSLEGDLLLAADVDGNNKINSIDLAYIQRYVLDIISVFPAEKK
ncbi:MAG: dockerin, partial [Clostridiaceae bacterium]|nr:dockerin [Clostridiaceae bacterium]